MESAIGEAAHLAGIDPVLYRKKLIGENSRILRVIKKIELQSNWFDKVPEGKGKGFAISQIIGGGIIAAVTDSVSFKKK